MLNCQKNQFPILSSAQSTQKSMKVIWQYEAEISIICAKVQCWWLPFYCCYLQFLSLPSLVLKHLIWCQAFCKEEDTLKLLSSKAIGYCSSPLKLYKDFGRNASVHLRMNNCIHIPAFPLSFWSCSISNLGRRLCKKWV